MDVNLEKKEEKEEIKDIILNKNPEDFGYNTSTCNGLILINLIEKRYNKKYKRAQIYNIIKSIGLTFQKGREKYYEANEEKREEFKKY